MNHDEFITQVQARTHLGSRGDAERVIRATLETLAERLDPPTADNLALHLPSEIARYLRTDVPFAQISLNEFFRRVQARESARGRSVGRAEAVNHARCVIDVLDFALTPGAPSTLRHHLRAELEPLLSVGSSGEMRVENRART